MEPKNYSMLTLGQLPYSHDKLEGETYMSDKLMTPVGEITTMCVKRASQKSGKKFVRLQFKDGDPGVDDFKAKLVALNPKKIIDSTVNPNVPEGHFQVNFATKGDIDVEVLDADGNRYAPEDIPTFSFETDTGKALAVGVISTVGMQPTAYLKLLRIVELNQAPRQVDPTMAAARGNLDAIHNS